MKKALAFILVLACLAALSAQAVTEVSQPSEELRIVSLGPNVTEIIYALGAGDNLVGRTDYCNYPDQALSVTSIGTLWEPNLEAILALNADVAIASSIVDPSFIESLGKAGITAYQFYEEESLEGTFKLVQEVADAIGKTAEGEAIVASMKARIEAVQAKVAAIPEGQRKSTMYIISYGDWGDYAATGETYLNDVIEAAGAVNAAKDGMYWSISKELLLSQDPDTILLGAYSYTDTAATIADFSSLAPYSELTASKTGNVFTINGDAAERQGVRTADTVEEIARLLYPELF
ncbi:MAG: ABC transporter substrate-binding protein [Spirochaetales bacterium]|nr:ABC transporter substrate-binding protein [Spirochaetales bacterium]